MSAGFLLYNLSSVEFIQSMERIEGARGLITFFFSFTTMAVVILVMLSIFWVDADEVDKRFAKAKDVLTILIGVLGTIMRFYFGSAVERPAPSFADLKLNPASISSALDLAMSYRFICTDRIDLEILKRFRRAI